MNNNEKELKQLSEKLFKGNSFVIFSEEEENTEDYKRYNQLMKEKLKKTKENMIKYSSLINQ